MTEKPAYINLVIIWQFIAAFLWFIGLVAVIVFAFPFSPGYEGSATVEVGDVFGMIVGTLFVIGSVTLAVISGVGLSKRKPWGRVIGITNTGISLILAPIGTIVGVFVLIYLLRSEVRDYYKSGF